jgi:hypothetical protein
MRVHSLFERWHLVPVFIIHVDIYEY